MSNEEEVKKYFENHYPPYQATYMKAEINLCVRGDGKEEVMRDLKDMIKDWGVWVGAQGEASAMKPTTASQNNESAGTCPNCNSDLVFKSGTSKKTGNPWQAHFCSNSKCKFVKWL